MKPQNQPITDYPGLEFLGTVDSVDIYHMPISPGDYLLRTHHPLQGDFCCNGCLILSRRDYCSPTWWDEESRSCETTSITCFIKAHHNLLS